MSLEGRRWRCPLCGREYHIPVTIDDPMACPECMGRVESTATPVRVEAEDVANGEPGGRSNPESVDVWVAALQEQSSPRTWDSATLAEVEAVSSPGTRRRRRAVLVVAMALFVATAVGLLFAFRPYGIVDVFLRPPEVSLNRNAAAPLVAIVEFATRMPASATVTIDDGERQWSFRPDRPLATQHRVALFGLRPGRRHEITVEAESSSGWFAEKSQATTIETPPLPEDFPPIRTVVSQPEKMEPGVTLFAVNRWDNDKRDYDYGYIVMLDEQGEVVWYFRSGRGTADLRMISNGRLLCVHSNYRVAYEVDLLGYVQRDWQVTGTPSDPIPGAIPIATDTIHHELAELPWGNFLAISTELRLVDDFPTSETDSASPPAPSHVVGDVIIEFTPNGEVVREYKLFDLLDYRRIGYDSLGNFWRSHYDVPLEVDSRDWSHANAAFYDPRDDSVIVSVRHQDCLIKIDRKSGELVWILGDHHNWGEPWQKYLLTPKGEPFEWPYHQHGPQLTPRGTILMYDNGNHRALPFHYPTPPSQSYSRVVEFRVDEKEMTVEQVWEYRGEKGETFYCPFYCEADLMPQTGNILVTDGGHIETEDGKPANAIPSAYQWARLFELEKPSGDEIPEKVFEVRIDSGPAAPEGWSVYRSDRLPDVSKLSEMATEIVAETPLGNVE